MKHNPWSLIIAAFLFLIMISIVSISYFSTNSIIQYNRNKADEVKLEHEFGMSR